MTYLLARRCSNRHHTVCMPTSHSKDNTRTQYFRRRGDYAKGARLITVEPPQPQSMLLSQMSNPASRDLNKTQTHSTLEYDEVVPDHDDDSAEDVARRPAPRDSVARSPPRVDRRCVQTRYQTVPSARLKKRRGNAFSSRECGELSTYFNFHSRGTM